MMHRRVYLKRPVKKAPRVNIHRILIDELKMPTKFRHKIITTLNLWQESNYTIEETQFILENRPLKKI